MNPESQLLAPVLSLSRLALPTPSFQHAPSSTVEKEEELWGDQTFSMIPARYFEVQSCLRKLSLPHAIVSEDLVADWGARLPTEGPQQPLAPQQFPRKHDGITAFVLFF